MYRLAPIFICTTLLLLWTSVTSVVVANAAEHYHFELMGLTEQLFRLFD